MPTLSGSSGSVSGATNVTVSYSNPANASFQSLTCDTQFFSQTSYLTTAYIQTCSMTTATMTTLAVTGTSAMTGQLTCAGPVSIAGALSAASTAAISGPCSLSSTLAVSGAATLSSALSVAGVSTLGGAVGCNSTLSVNGATNLTGLLTCSGGQSVVGVSTLSGAVGCGSTLAVTGATTLSSTLTTSGQVTTPSLNVTGVTTSASLTVTGALAAASGAITTLVGNSASFTSLIVQSSGNLELGRTAVKSFTKTLGTTVNNATNICILTSTNVSSYVIRMMVIQKDTNNQICNSYEIPVTYNNTSSTWRRLCPIASSGPYGSSDWHCDVQTTGLDVCTLRLVRVASGGSVASTGFTAILHIHQQIWGQIDITDDSTTSTGVSNSGIYESCLITQCDGVVGIGTSLPSSSYMLDVRTGVIGQRGTAVPSLQFNSAVITVSASTTSMIVDVTDINFSGFTPCCVVSNGDEGVTTNFWPLSATPLYYNGSTYAVPGTAGGGGTITHVRLYYASSFAGNVRLNTSVFYVPS